MIFSSPSINHSAVILFLERKRIKKNFFRKAPPCFWMIDNAGKVFLLILFFFQKEKDDYHS